MSLPASPLRPSAAQAGLDGVGGAPARASPVFPPFLWLSSSCPWCVCVSHPGPSLPRVACVLRVRDIAILSMRSSHHHTCSHRPSMEVVRQGDNAIAAYIGSETTAQRGVEDPQPNLYSLPRPTCSMADQSWWTGWWWRSTWWNTSDRWQPPDEEQHDAPVRAAQAAWDHAPEPAQAEWDWDDEDSSSSSDVPMQRREQWANSLWEGDVIGTVTSHEVKKMSNQLPQRQIDELPGPGEAAPTAAPLTRLIIIGSNYGSIRRRAACGRTRHSC